MYWKKKTLLAKIEATYGVDSAPTGAANAILCTNITLNPMEGEDVSRNLERPYFGAQQQLPVGLNATLTFDVEIAGSGTLGTAPGWGVLMRACAVAEVLTATTKVEYSPISSALESASIAMNIDGTLHKLLGARGTFVAKINAQGIPVFSFSFTGLFVQPTAGALPTPVYTAFKDPQVATNANTPIITVGALPMVARSFEFDRGAQVEKRFLLGKESIEITDAMESIKLQVEAVDLATYNPYTAPTGVPKAIALAHGTNAVTRVKFDFPNAAQRRPSYTNQQGIVEWPLTFDPLPGALGNDQWKITLS